MGARKNWKTGDDALTRYALSTTQHLIEKACAFAQAKKKKILANREKLLTVEKQIEANVVSKQKAIDVNLTCLHVLQHMDWEAAKQQAQALDTDGDGLVSHQEILALVKECVPTRDADKDGEISHEEYLDYVKQRVAAGKK